MAGRHRSGQSARWQLLAALGVVVVIVLAVGGGIVAANRGGDNGTSNLAQTQPSVSATPSPSATPTVAQAHTVSADPTPSRSTTPATTPTHAPTHSASPRSATTRAPATLRITWTQRTWVRVTDVTAGVVVLTGSHEPGYSAHWDGARYYVEIGNSGGVLVSTNGGNAYAPGPVGQIRRLTVTRSRG